MHTGKLSSLAVSGVLLLSACATGGTPADPAAAGPTAGATATVDAPGVRVVSPNEAADLAERPGVVVVDVRTPAEFAEGHLAGALNIDVQSADAGARFAALDPDASYVIYCHSGNRSATAREHLRGLGFRDVADVEGGIVAWQAAGLPVTS